MGGRNIAEGINGWILTNHPKTAFSLYQITDELGFTSKQVHPVLRRFVADGKLERVSAQEWRVIAQTPAANDATPIGENYDSPARRAREEAREARKAVEPEAYAYVDTLQDGALLLRGTDGNFYRGELTYLG